jgi:opine dehydrogenase
MKHRYITEDVPYGLVGLSSLGRMLSIPTPKIDSLITIASMANDIDYYATGRTMESIGISNMSLQELIRYITGKE